MKKRRNIIIIISIAVCIAIGIFMFNENSELKQRLEQTHSNEEVTLVKREEFLKDSLVSATLGTAIYVVFYGIPHDYKVIEEKNKKKQ